MNTPEEAKAFYASTLEQLLDKHHDDLLSHREHLMDYDLSALESEQPRTIHVTFHQPPAERLIMALLPLQMAMEKLVPEEELETLAEQTVQQFRETHDLNTPRSTTRRIGNTTVYFEESAEENPVHLTINDTPVRLFEPRAMPISEYMPALLSCHQAIEKIAQDKQEVASDFPTSIDIHDHGSISVDFNSALNLAPALLLEMPAETWPDILRHERGHVINGDTDGPRMEETGFNQLQDINALFDELHNTLLNERTPSDYFFQPDFAESFAEDKATLKEAMEGCKALSAHIHEFPEYDSLDTLGFAADLHEQTGLFNHLGKAEPIEELDEAMDIAAAFQSTINPAAIKDSEGMGEVSLQQADENFAQFKTALSKLMKDYAPVRAELRTACENMMQAREHLADVESVKYADDPHAVRKTFEFLEKNTPDIPDDILKTHPPHATRIETSTRFADRVQQMRENERNAERGR